METIIRNADSQDADAITAMLGRLAAEIGDGDKFLCDADAIRRYGFGETPLMQFLIAEGDGRHHGLVTFFPLFSTIRGKPGVYVQDLWVSEKARSQGLGDRLLGAVAARAAAQWRAAYLGLTVYEDNPRAVEFYRRLGFRGDQRDLPVVLGGAEFQKLKDRNPT